MKLNKILKLGFGKIEAIKSAKSAGVAGVGASVFAVIGSYLPEPFSDPLIGIPVLTWGVNSARHFLQNHEIIDG